MLLKASSCVKRYDRQTKWIKSALIPKKNLMTNLFAMEKTLKTKLKCYGDEATHFHEKEIRKVVSCLGFCSLKG